MNEKLLETLFNRFALQCFRLGEAWIHTPSSREEFIEGYDSKITGMGCLHEIILQFKKPNPTQSGFTILVTPHQHKTLRERYGPRTAYYVSATFRNFVEIQEAQLQVKTAADFLRYYVAVEIPNTLPHDVQFIQFERDEKSWIGRNIKYKCERDGATKKASHAVTGRGGWENGSSLIRKFKQRSTGHLARLLDDSQVDSEYATVADSIEQRVETWSPSLAELVEMAEANRGFEFPTALRTH